MKRALLLALGLVTLSSMPVSARLWNVKPDGTGDAPTIDAAIDSAGSRGDTVRVAAGIYYEHDIRILESHVILTSATGQADCATIDARQLGRVLDVSINVDARCTIKGFTIRGGRHNVGAGVFIEADASPNLVNLSIEENVATGWGGGMYLLEGASPTLTNVSFMNNSATHEGSALYVEGYAHPTLWGCHFHDNVGAKAALRLPMHASASLTDVEFGWNDVAVEINEASLELSGCTFYENSNAAMRIDYSSVQCSGCTFLSNGSGVSIMQELPAGSVWINSVFAKNRGTAMRVLSASPLIQNCSFVENAGSGSAIAIEEMQYVSSPVVVERSIFAYGQGGCPIFCGYGADSTSIALSCCDVYRNGGGDWVDCIAGEIEDNTNFSRCPSFCLWDVEPYDLRLSYRLCDQSPCLPGNHPKHADCGLIGALGLGCSCGPSSMEPTTWGAIKAMYK